jgi:hypothetical protein
MFQVKIPQLEGCAAKVNRSVTEISLQPETEQMAHNFKTEVLALLRCCAALVGSLLTTFRDNVPAPFSIVKDCFTSEDGADMLSRNVGNKLPTKIAQTSEESEDLTFNVREA